MFTKEINPQTVSGFFFLPVNKQHVQHKPAQKTHLEKSQLVQNGRLSEAMKDCTISRQMSNPCCAWCQSVYLHQVQAFLSPVSTNGDAATGLNLAPFSASKQVHTLIWPFAKPKPLLPPQKKLFKLHKHPNHDDYCVQKSVPLILIQGQYCKQCQQAWFS